MLDHQLHPLLRPLDSPERSKDHVEGRRARGSRFHAGFPRTSWSVYSTRPKVLSRSDAATVGPPTNRVYSLHVVASRTLREFHTTRECMRFRQGRIRATRVGRGMARELAGKVRSCQGGRAPTYFIPGSWNARLYYHLLLFLLFLLHSFTSLRDYKGGPEWNRGRRRDRKKIFILYGRAFSSTL